MRPTYLLPALLACAACVAQPQAGPASQAAQACFWPSQVSGFSDAGPDRALVRIGTRETWELTLSPGCPDVDWAMKIGIKSRSGERICSGRPAELLVPNASGSGLRSCMVSSVRRLSPEEAAVDGQTSAP
ncbi:hypothetical protein D1610_14955 [Sphingomonas gilva]|uniref:Uncharacterized protein n=2 Tax=Sphingomonas gilva TaxID=2305907 RepID=A0A396RKB0_9SPHN|nr:hypothetical protein D1610_14955 [Sphingomonas gilva]